MASIYINVPENELRKDFEEVIKRLNYQNIQLEMGNYLGRSQEMIRKIHSDVVIARGMGAMDIREKLPHVHVIELEMTVYDVYLAIMACKEKFGAQKIGVLYTDTAAYNIDMLCKMTDITVVSYPIQQESDILEALEVGLFSGIDAFVGGKTAFMICRERNIPFAGIRVGKEGVERALREAYHAICILEQERAKTTLMEKLLDCTHDIVVAVDQEGHITQMNKKARALFHLHGDFGRVSIDSYFPESNWKERRKDTQPFEWVTKMDGRLCMVHSTPILVNKECMGVLFEIQNSEQIRKAESKIRSELSKKGLVAKYQFDDILGDSEQIRQNIHDARKYSHVPSNVLIIGETGTGKELFAHSIHQESDRANEPFVAVNCAALPENLLDSELFGYVEGSFSGANKGGKLGLFEQAHKGTIFLDEIGEIPIALQAKLLRVLQEKEIRRIGDDKIISVDVRVISATNINIEEQVKSGGFRADLYYRLNLLDIRLYPLRQRRQDVSILAKHFISRCIQKMKSGIQAVDPEALVLLEAYNWPGNARELRNICEKLVALCEGDTLGVADVKHLRLSNDPCEAPEPSESSITDAQLLQLIDEMGIKKGELAKQLGISRSTLWRRLNKASEDS